MTGNQQERRSQLFFLFRKSISPFHVLNMPTSSSETQGQIVGARESLNERKSKAQRKVKNGEKSPWGQRLTRPVPNGRRLSGFWLVPEKHKGLDPFNQNFRKFRSKTQWIGSVQPEKFWKNGSTFWGGPIFPVWPVGILVEWMVPKFSGTNQKPERQRPFGTGLVRHCPQGLFWLFFNFLLCHIFPPV